MSLRSLLGEAAAWPPVLGYCLLFLELCGHSSPRGSSKKSFARKEILGFISCYLSADYEVENRGVQADEFSWLSLLKTSVYCDGMRQCWR